MPLVDFIRYKQNLKGTKIGCREGDCGACTVLAGELIDDKISYKSITSCITPLKFAAGKHIVTVDGLNSDEIGSVQQHIHEHGATQCGFCTPGFVMSLTGFSLSTKKADYSDALSAVAGNICRCTGYKSIEKAIFDISEELKSKPEKDNIAWLIKNDYLPEYFIEIPERIKNLKNEISNKENGIVVGGGTDLYVQKADCLLENKIKTIKYISSKEKITQKDNLITLSALTTVTDIIESEIISNLFPKLAKQLLLISSEQIRNTATIGGNIVNASPIGDMSIILLALNSNLIIKNSSNIERTILLKDFHTGYKTFDLKEGELIENITFEIPNLDFKFNFEKVSKRKHLDIASVNSSILIIYKNNIIKDVHISGGGLAATPKYFEKTREFLINKEINKENILKAAEIIQAETSPISDVRGTTEYKKLLLRQLFYAHFIEIFSIDI